MKLNSIQNWIDMLFTDIDAPASGTFVAMGDITQEFLHSHELVHRIPHSEADLELDMLDALGIHTYVDSPVEAPRNVWVSLLKFHNLYVEVGILLNTADEQGNHSYQLRIWNPDLVPKLLVLCATLEYLHGDEINLLGPAHSTLLTDLGRLVDCHEPYPEFGAFLRNQKKAIQRMAEHPGLFGNQGLSTDIF